MGISVISKTISFKDVVVRYKKYPDAWVKFQKITWWFFIFPIYSKQEVIDSKTL